MTLSQFNATDANDDALVVIKGGTDNTSIGNTSDSLKTNVTNASGASAVNIQDGGNSITVDGTVAATQSGTWTVQPGNTANTTPWLATINQGGNSATVSAANALKVDGSAVTQPVSAASLPLPTGAATETTLAKLPLAQGSATSGQSGVLEQGAVTTAAPTYTTGQTSPLSLTTAGALRTDGSATTQPVSAASLPLPTGAATSALQTTGNSSLSSIDTKLTTTNSSLSSIDAGIPTALGQTTMAASMSVAFASDQSALAITAASLPLPTGAATSANQSTEITALQIIDDVPTAQNAALVKGVPIMGQLDDTSTTAATEDNVSAVRITSQRAIHTNLRNTSGTEIGTTSSPLVVTDAPQTGEDLVFGSVALSLLGSAAVRATTYTEPSSNSQRSFVSSSVLDTSAGTGARTVQLTYYTATFTGPFTETVTLNGITAVNTVATNICYIENMVIITAGSGGTNAGTISLKAGAAGAGITVGSVTAGDNQTLWAHHYVPTGKTAYITTASVGNNSTTSGSGGIFIIKSKPLSVSNSVELQVSEFLRAAGAQSTTVRPFDSYIPVVGPARLTLYVSPEAASTVTQYGGFDFFEV